MDPDPDSEQLHSSTPVFEVSPLSIADTDEIEEFDGSLLLLSNSTPPAVAAAAAAAKYRQRQDAGEEPGPESLECMQEEEPPSQSYRVVQLDELAEEEWREIGRWIKYEEDLEEGSERLGRPHIAPILFHYLVKLSHIIEKNALLLLDLTETGMQGVARRVAEGLVNAGPIDAHEAPPLVKDLLLPHRRVEDTSPADGRRGRGLRRGWLGAGRTVVPDGLCFDGGVAASSSRSMTPLRRRSSGSRSRSRSGSPAAKSELGSIFSVNDVDGVAAGGETVLIMVRGEHRRNKGVLVLVRLLEPAPLINTPAAVVRVIFLLLAPSGREDDFLELGRSLGTLMSNQAFYNGVILADAAGDLVQGINAFLSESIVLPPGDWYNSNFYDLFPLHVLQEKSKLIQERHERKFGARALAAEAAPSAPILPKEGVESHATALTPSEIGEEIPGPFVRTGKPFGGLINDIRRRYPLYGSDITTGLNLQTFSACIFLYFASIAHNVTFGGIMNEKTEGLIGVTETLLAASLAGMFFATTSGQPLNVIAPTGPLLVFDELLYKYLEGKGIEFLPARAWISLWVVVICVTVLYYEGARHVRLFTRFTQETFACLISIIFVYESFQNLAEVYHEHPLGGSLSARGSYTQGHQNSTPEDGADGGVGDADANTALLCTLLMLGTFYIAMFLKHFRNSSLLGTRLRNVLADFAVPISILVMVSFDVWVAGGVYTDKITVPPGLQPTRPSERGWFVNPFGMKQRFDPWVPAAMFLPGLLVFILVFMTVEICELIILKKPKVVKGCGLNLDALILSVCNLGAGFFGTPWLSCATLKVLAHLAALTVYSKNDPPGQAHSIVMVLEQRVSAFVMSILLGLSIGAAGALQAVSMSVLFGVFLYMGISSLHGNQLFERIILFFVPPGEHPSTESYVRRVPTAKIHAYTLIQLGLLAVLWGVKSIKQIALTFPFVLMLLVPIRLNLGRFFTESELEALDG